MNIITWEQKSWQIGKIQELPLIQNGLHQMHCLKMGSKKERSIIENFAWNERSFREKNNIEFKYNNFDNSFLLEFNIYDISTKSKQVNSFSTDPSFLLDLKIEFFL